MSGSVNHNVPGVIHTIHYVLPTNKRIKLFFEVTKMYGLNTPEKLQRFHSKLTVVCGYEYE